MTDITQQTASIMSFISRFKTILIMGLLLAVSIGINTWLLMGKGITVHHSYDHRSYHYQNQSQAQAQMTFVLPEVYLAQGKLIWKVINLSTIDYLSMNEPVASRLEKALMDLTPAEALLCRVFTHGQDVLLAVPKIEPKK